VSVIEQQITVETADGSMTTFVYGDRDAGLPHVIMFHDGPGLRPDVHRTASEFAAKGYVVALPDLYYRIEPLMSLDLAEMAKGPGAEAFDKMMQGVTETTPDRTEADATALLATLQADGADVTRVGVLGFCHTARAVVRMMARHGDQFVVGGTMHPARCIDETPQSPHLDADKISGALYVGYGGGDTRAPVDQQQPLIDRLREAPGAVEIEILPDAEHGFAFGGSEADQAAAARGWERIRVAFAAALGS